MREPAAGVSVIGSLDELPRLLSEQRRTVWALPVGLPAGEHVEDLEHMRLMVQGEANAPRSDPKSVLWWRDAGETTDIAFPGL